VERKSPVADTGCVVALLNNADPMHSAVQTVYNQYQKILLPQTVLTEVAYLLGRDSGIATVVTLLRSISASRFRLVALTEQDLNRAAEILEQYTDSRVDFVDATVMAVAERYNSTKILTLERRDFELFRPRHCNNFEILP